VPWAYPTNVPSCAKNWTAEEQQECVKAANAVLREGGSEQDAIFACIRNAGRTKHPGGKKVMSSQESPTEETELEDGERDKAHAAQQARAKKYGISIRKGGNVTKPGEWSHVPDEQFADPVNYSYPCPDKKQTQAAIRYWGMPRNRSQYSSKDQAKISARLRRFAAKFGVEAELEEALIRGENPDLRSVLVLQSPGVVPEAIPIHVLGRWANHPVYPPFEMNEPMMEQAIANFETKVHRPNAELAAQIVVDERHAGTEACGWVTGLFKQLPYLMAAVDWTEHGREVVGDRRYRFVSPLYTEHFIGPDGEDHGVVVKEATLTNRNYLKELPAIGQPLLLSEDVRAEAQREILWPEITPPQGGSHMADKNKEKDKGLANPAPDGEDKGAQETPQAAPGTVTLTAEEFKVLQQSHEQHTKLVAQLGAAEKNLAQLEGEAKQRQIQAAIKAAGDRGVDAFTLSLMGKALAQLPRNAEPQFEIVLEEGKPASKLDTFSLLLYFLEHVPSTVPQGEQSKSQGEPMPEHELSDEDKKAAKSLADEVSDEPIKENEQ